MTRSQNQGKLSSHWHLCSVYQRHFALFHAPNRDTFINLKKSMVCPALWLSWNFKQIKTLERFPALRNLPVAFYSLQYWSAWLTNSPSVTGRAWAPVFGAGFGWDVKWWRLEVAMLTISGLPCYGRLLQDFLEMVPKSYKSHLAAGTHKLVVNRSEILWWDSCPLVILHSFNKDIKLGLKTAH